MNNNGYLIYQAERPLSRTELRAVDTARGEAARSLWVPITYATRRYSSMTPPARLRRRRRK